MSDQQRYPEWGGMIIANSTEIDADAARETHAAAVEAARVAKETREFVLERYQKLKGCDLPVEITSIQLLPSHNCLIVNDLLLLSFVEAKALLEQIDE